MTGLRRHKVAVASILLLFVGAIALWFYFHTRHTEVALDSIAVLPFQNRSTEPDTEYLSDGLTESLIYRLSQFPNIRVSPTSSVFRYKGQETDPIKVGAELGVNAVLSGRIVERGDNLTISAELVDVRQNKLLWGEQYQRKTSELLTTQREIAREIVDKLKLQVTGTEAGLAKHYTESNEAYQLYLKGRFYWNKRSEEGLNKAEGYFQQAIDQDPNFALAYSGLADTLAIMAAPEAGGDKYPNDVQPKVKAAALKAMELDDTLAEPHVSMAHAKYYYDRDFPAAEGEFRKAIELNPNYAIAHHWYAIYLSVVGRNEEALAEIRRARELDPLNLPINVWLGRFMAISGQLDQGIEQLRKTVELYPTSSFAHDRLGVLYEDKGMLDQAVVEFNETIRLSARPLGLAGLAHAYALMGKRQDAQASLNELLELSKQRYISGAAIATVYVALGDKDRAFEKLEEANQAHDLNVLRVRQDPRFAPIRSDPRFAVLVRRLGLP